MRVTKLRSSFIMIAVPVMVLAGMAHATSAQAYAVSPYKWPNNLNVPYYVYGSAGTHTNWINIIATQASQWNNVSNAANPTLTRTGNSSALITFSQSTISPTLCAATYMNHNSSGSIIYADIFYNTVTFTDNGTNGTCAFYWATAHEIGHAEGLDHSSVPYAVMYNPQNGQRTLQGDDIAGIRAIY